MKNIFSKYEDSFKQILKFGLVGGGATALHLLVSFSFLHAGFDVYVANLCAFICAFLLSYIGHNYWTFSMACWSFSSLFRAFFVAGVGFIANNLLLTLFIRIFLMSEKIALSFTMLFLPLLSYIGNRIWVFKKNR